MENIYFAMYLSSIVPSVNRYLFTIEDNYKTEVE